MSLSNLRSNLPVLEPALIDVLFEHVYDIAGIEEALPIDDEKTSDVVDLVKSLQRFNFHHRMDEAFELHRKAAIPAGFELQSNSEGSDLWLAMLLAIRELYGLSLRELIDAIQKTGGQD